MTKHIVATVDEIPVGQRKIIEINGRSIGLFNIDGEFYAIRNRCPHQGAALCTGYLTGFLQSDKPGEYNYAKQGEIVRCPWHGWEFDIKTGQSWFDPVKMRVRSYQVSVESVAPDDLEPPLSGLEAGPYVAETYPVSVEQSYVLIEL